MNQKEDLDKAIIETINEQALQIFDREVKPKTLGELRQGINESVNNGRWRDELFHVISKIAGGRRFSPVQAVFHTLDAKIYRPVVHAVDRSKDADEIKSFHVTFADEVGALDTSNMPNAFANLATMLRLAFRFRWEILEKFGKGELSEGDIEKFENVLQRIEQDARSRGVADRDSIDLSFFTLEEQHTVSEMYSYWYSLRDQTGDSGELDIAMHKKDAKKISAILKTMFPLNQEFLEMAANRFSEMVAAKD